MTIVDPLSERLGPAIPHKPRPLAGIGDMERRNLEAAVIGFGAWPECDVMRFNWYQFVREEFEEMAAFLNSAKESTDG